jgi:hypothetical protein
VDFFLTYFRISKKFISKVSQLYSIITFSGLFGDSVAFGGFVKSNGILYFSKKLKKVSGSK